METKDICADLIIKTHSLKAITTVFSDTFTGGSNEDIIRCVAAQPDTFSYLVYVISEYANDIAKKAEDLETSLYCKQ